MNGVPENPAKHFQFDMESVGGWFDLMPIEGMSEVVQETDEWQVIRNGAGAYLKYWKNKSGPPEHIDFRMTEREIWENEYKPLLMPSESRLSIEKDRASLLSARERGVWAFYGHMGLWELMRGCLGDICMYETLLLDPEWILDFNKTYTEFYIAQYKILFEKSGRPDGVWIYDDLAYNKGTFCSPDVLRELYQPFYTRIVDFFHSQDLPVVFHCCGNMGKALPMIVEMGCDALNPMERKAGCDPLQFARDYREQLAFVGGLNAVTLESGDKDAIMAETDELIDGMREIGAAYIFGSDHSLSPQVRYSDFKMVTDHFKANRDY